MYRRLTPFAGLTWLLIASTASLVWSPSSYALDPPYLAEMPSLAKVRADTEGKDRLDTLARRTAVLKHLQRVVEDMARDRRYGKLTVDEKRVRNTYGEEVDRIMAEITETLGAPPKVVDPNAPPPDEPSAREKWFSAEWTYERDDTLRRATLATYLSRATLAQLGEAEEYAAEMAEAGRQASLRGTRRSEWSSMSDDEQEGAIAFGMLTLVVALLLSFRELRRFGLAKGSARDLRAGFARYHLDWMTGVVEKYHHWVEGTKTTTTEKFSDGSSRTTVRVDATNYEAFDLIGKHGVEHVVITDAKLNLANGQLLTGVWATRKGKSSWVLFCDRGTGAFKPVVWQLRHILRARRWPMVPLLGFAFMIGSSTGILEFGRIGSMNGLLRGLLAMLLALAPLFFVFAMFGIRRARKFVKRDAPKILAAVQAEEAAAT